jgi:26S proteasome regulatory subunit N13
VKSNVRLTNLFQAVSMFSAALQSGQLGPVVQQFEVGSDAVNAANQGDLEEFVRSLQKAKKGSESPKDDEMME